MRKQPVSTVVLTDPTLPHPLSSLPNVNSHPSDVWGSRTCGLPGCCTGASQGTDCNPQCHLVEGGSVALCTAVQLVAVHKCIMD
jgi:hypothetical protein